MYKKRLHTKKKRQDNFFSPNKYHTIKSRQFPNLKPLHTFHPNLLENMLTFMLPRFCELFESIIQDEAKLLSPQQQDVFNEYLAFYVRCQKIHQKQVNRRLKFNIPMHYNQFLDEFEILRFHPCIIKAIQQAQDNIKTTQPEVFKLVKHHEKLVELQYLSRYGGRNLTDPMLKRKLNRAWKIFRHILRMNPTFESSTTQLDMCERLFFDYVLFGKIGFKVDNYLTPEIIHALIKISNYPVVPYIEGIIERFYRDKHLTKFYPQTKKQIENRESRIPNPDYINKIDNEQAYHLWLALRHHYKKGERINGQFHELNDFIEIETSKAYDVFLKYGSRDEEKFNMLIKNNKEFFKFENDILTVYDTITVCKNFGFENPTLQKYYRPLPSRRLFRACLLSNIAEFKYLQTEDDRKEYEANCYGFVNDDLVAMPHGRSVSVISSKFKVSDDTVYNWIRNHPKKQKRIHLEKEYRSEEKAIDKQMELEKKNRQGNYKYIKNRYEIYYIEDGKRYIVADTHVSNFYGGTWLYLGNVEGVPNPDELYGNVDVYDPYRGKKIKCEVVIRDVKKVKTHEERNIELENEYQLLEARHRKTRMEVLKIYEDLRNRRIFEFDYKQPESEKKHLEYLENKCKEFKIEKEKINVKMNEFGFLEDAEYNLYRKMRTKRMIKLIDSGIGFEVVVGKDRKYPIHRNDMPKFFKEVTKSMAFDMEVNFIAYGYEFQLDSKYIKEKIKPLAKRKYNKKVRVFRGGDK